LIIIITRILSRSLESHCICLSVPNSPYPSQLIQGSRKLEVQFPFVFRVHPTRQRFRASIYFRPPRSTVQHPLKRQSVLRFFHCHTPQSLHTGFLPVCPSVILMHPNEFYPELPNFASTFRHLAFNTRTGVGTGPITSNFRAPSRPCSSGVLARIHIQGLFFSVRLCTTPKIRMHAATYGFSQPV
jgi:hypothetical protein